MPRKTPTGGIIIGVVGFNPLPPFDPFTGLLGIPYVVKNPIQIAGLNPLFPCTSDECRDLQEDDIQLLAFGNLISGVAEANPSYKNDFLPVWIDMSIYTSNPNSTSVSFILQKIDVVTNTWEDDTILNNNTLGNLYALNTIPNHPTYTGFELNWGLVLQLRGIGTYRIKISTLFKSSKGCLVTDCYKLYAFNCDLAHGTVKFETWLTGKVGDPYKDYYLHDLCGMMLYDSVRLPGFFGFKKVAEYRERLLEWGDPKHGYQERLTDEAVFRYDWESKYLPQPFHDRFSTFTMCEELRVSDYNINNSDYSLKRVLMVKDGNYEPEYLDEHFRRKSKVKQFYKRGVQSVIKNVCCTRLPGL